MTELGTMTNTDYVEMLNECLTKEFLETIVSRMIKYNEFVDEQDLAVLDKNLDQRIIKQKIEIIEKDSPTEEFIEVVVKITVKGLFELSNLDTKTLVKKFIISKSKIENIFLTKEVYKFLMDMFYSPSSQESFESQESFSIELTKE